MRRNDQAFTLIEMAIAVMIMVVMLAVAVPSLSGVMQDRRLRHSLDEMNKLVQTAQERSVTERRAYLIVWQKGRVVLRPEALKAGEEDAPTQVLTVRKGDTYLLNLPAALIKKPPGEWIFWPSGTCEPAIVSFDGVDGSWSAKYATLSARAEIASYVAK